MKLPRLKLASLLACGFAGSAVNGLAQSPTLSLPPIPMAGNTAVLLPAEPPAPAPVVSEAAAVASEPAAPANPYAGDLFTRNHLTGDWLGLRSGLASKGFTLEVYSTQYFQGVTRGGDSRAFDFGGKLDYLANLDAHKLGLWQGFFVGMHAETRYGSDVNGYDGLLAPSNLLMAFPEADRSITSITGLKLTQALSENFAVYAGKINTLDEYPIRYNPQVTGLPGHGGFMNSSLIFNPIAARTVPYSAAGAGFAYLKEGEPVFSLSVFDPEERATKGLEDLYERGVVIVPDLILRGEPFGRPGVLNLGGTYSNAKYRSDDPAAYLNILRQFLQGNPGAITQFPEETGSWSVYSNFYQALWVDGCDKDRNWGVFGQFGLSDGNPNPIRYVANGGLGGRSMIPCRKLDTFGVGCFYLGLSDNFKRLSAPFAPQRDEYGLEVFYNYAITPWCRLTSDVQFARPSTVGLDTSILTGLRLQMQF